MNLIATKASIISYLIFVCRYLASGCSLTDLHYSYRIGTSTLSGIIQGVCKMIWDKLKDVHVPFPTQDKWLEIASGFNEHANFPNCLGAVHGKHVRIIKPCHSGSAY
jgi:hypothetical protein